jgi:dipeptidyl-peptidase-3
MATLEGFKEEYELNSTVVIGSDGRPEELVWRAGDPGRGIPPGLYAREIKEIISYLEKAREFAPAATARALDALVRAYRSGSVEDLRAYDIAWVEDDQSVVDTVNGFVEVYADPRGKKGSWEGIVSYEDPAKAHLIKLISENAQWFEDHMPFDAQFRKGEVKGISARFIDVIIETGDCGPVSPIGINLPNDQNVREQHGSKSVNLANIVDAYYRSRSEGVLEEFCWNAIEVERAREWGPLVQDLLTNMHEVIGHASGQQAPDRQGDPADWIKENYSALEEARADLIALYFMLDPQLEELGLLDGREEAALAAYERYTRNGGLQQLRRIPEGEQIEEDHMRNRQMIVHWIMANSGAIEKVTRDGKTYLRVRDTKAWREATGRLLALVQKIKSTGDYVGAKALFDEHGIRFDSKLRDEVVDRYKKLNVPSYAGFIMPRLTAIMGNGGEIEDVKISYPLSIEQQMLEWSGRRAPPAVD